MPKSQEDKSSSPKGGIVFQGETFVKGDIVERKEIHGNEIHGNQYVGGDNISIKGDGNILGNQNSSQIIKINNEALAAQIDQLNEKVNAIHRLSASDKKLLKSTLQELKNEVQKGDEADTDKISPWLKMLKKTAPEIVGNLLEVLVHPFVGKLVEVISKAILKD
ncbi:MAG: hypothetical protein HYZ25_12390 [Chloroflexi bacterium]|nr:hypothetical protein [Chloroflexota bacterium]